MYNCPSEVMKEIYNNVYASSKFSVESSSNSGFSV